MLRLFLALVLLSTFGASLLAAPVEEYKYFYIYSATDASCKNVGRVNVVAADLCLTYPRLFDDSSSDQVHIMYSIDMDNDDSTSSIITTYYSDASCTSIDSTNLRSKQLPSILLFYIIYTLANKICAQVMWTMA